MLIAYESNHPLRYGVGSRRLFLLQVLVRCEEAVVSGSLIRRKYEMLRWMNKKMLTNPKKGPLHYRAPSRYHPRRRWRCVL